MNIRTKFTNSSSSPPCTNSRRFYTLRPIKKPSVSYIVVLPAPTFIKFGILVLAKSSYGWQKNGKFLSKLKQYIVKLLIVLITSDVLDDECLLKSRARNTLHKMLAIRGF